jgi:diguanylate cyclase (GGDEF)-like protein
VDQVTAAALAVALVVNLIVLVLALLWARRNRLEGERGLHPAARQGSSAPVPWWDGRDDLSAERRAERAAAWPATAATADEPQAGDHPRAAEIFESLESPSSWRGIVTLEAARVTRYRRPATIVIADLEGLDRLASRLGPESVDRLVPAVAGTLRREARSADRVARLASARFGVLLPETDEIAAINWIERVRTTTDLWLEASAVSLRLRFGWAELGPDSDVDAVLDLARERLDSERHVRPNTNSHADAASVRPERPTGGRRATVGDATPSQLQGPSGSPLAAG